MFAGRGLTDQGLALASGRCDSSVARAAEGGGEGGGGSDRRLGTIVAHEEKLVLVTAMQMCKLEAEKIASEISGDDVAPRTAAPPTLGSVSKSVKRKQGTGKGPGPGAARKGFG